MTTFIILRLLYEAYFRFPHFRIKNVSMRHWINRSAEQLITYHIELKMKRSSDELVFEELWIDEKKYRFNLSNSKRKSASAFSKKETLRMNVLSEIKTDTEPIPNSSSSRGKVILSYTFRNKKKQIRFQKINVQEHMTLVDGIRSNTINGEDS
jgi:hypothetical protein